MVLLLVQSELALLRQDHDADKVKLAALEEQLSNAPKNSVEDAPSAGKSNTELWRENSAMSIELTRAKGELESTKRRDTAELTRISSELGNLREEFAQSQSELKQAVNERNLASAALETSKRDLERTNSKCERLEARLKTIQQERTGTDHSL